MTGKASPNRVDVRRSATAIAALWLLGAAVYAPWLRAPFVYDDETLILRGPIVRATAAHIRRNLGLAPAPWAALAVGEDSPGYSLFSPRYWTGVHVGARGVYRPLRELALGAVYGLFGPEPFAFHCVSLALHLVVIALVYLLGLRLAGGRAAAVASAALFAAHPVHVEAVLWAKNIAEILCGVAVAGGLAICLRVFDVFEKQDRAPSTSRGWRTAILGGMAGGLYCAGLFAKEMTLALPALATLSAWALLQGRPRKRALIWTSFFWAIGIVYVLFILYSFDLGPASVARAGAAASDDEALWLRPALTGKTYAFYFRLLFAPVNLSAQHHFYYPLSYGGAETWPWLAAFALLIGGAVALFRVRRRWLPLLAWPFACLLPVSNLIPIKGRPVGEQRLYVPSIGFCLLLGAAYAAVLRSPWAREGRWRMRLTRVCGLAMLVIFGGLTISRGHLWNSHRAFWKDMIRKSPVQSTANTEIAELYLASGVPRAALNHATAGRQLYSPARRAPVNSKAMALQAMALDELGRIEEGVKAYRETLSADPANGRARLSLGRLYGELGRHEDALREFGKFAELFPESARGFHNAGLTLCMMGRYAEGLGLLRKAHDRAPRDPAILIDMGRAYNDLGQREKSRRSFERALEMIREEEIARPGDAQLDRLRMEAEAAMGALGGT